MLQRLRLFNFQSHQKTEFEFSPNVNVVTGASDSGKSTVIRGLQWVFDNRPPGDAIKNWYSQERDKIAVDIDFFELTSLRKERLKGKSRYVIGDEIFEAIKQDVPEEVSTLANLSECNIQSQHEPYFFLNDTPGEVARKLNDLVGLNIIDTIFRNLDSRIRRVSSDIRTSTSTITNLKEELESLAHVDALYDEVVELEELVKKAEELGKETEVLKNLIFHLDQIEIELATISYPFEAEEQTSTLLVEIKKFGESQKECDILTGLISSLLVSSDDLKVETDWLECEPLCVELFNLLKEQDEVANDCVELTRWVNKIRSDNKTLEYESKQVGVLFTNYIAKLRSVKLCPICKSKITEATIKMIEESL